MNDMNKIKMNLELRGFTNISILQSAIESITHIYAEKGIMYYCIIAPHEGNNFTYVLRRSYKETFDRWSNADLEDFYDSADELLEELSYERDLELIIINRLVEY